MKKIAAWVLISILFFGAPVFAANEPGTKESVLKELGTVERRGFVSFVTLPGEVVRTFTAERKEHSRLWPVTYLPRMLTNLATRLASSVNDIVIMPVAVPISRNTTPLTRRFDLPDYSWQKE